MYCTLLPSSRSIHVFSGAPLYCALYMYSCVCFVCMALSCPGPVNARYSCMYQVYSGNVSYSCGARTYLFSSIFISLYESLLLSSLASSTLSAPPMFASGTCTWYDVVLQYAQPSPSSASPQQVYGHTAGVTPLQRRCVLYIRPNTPAVKRASAIFSAHYCCHTPQIPSVPSDFTSSISGAGAIEGSDPYCCILCT